MPELAAPELTVHESRPAPRERWPDSTLSLLRDPYRWISRRAATHGSPVFEARIMGERTACVTGPEAAGMFYGSGHLTRKGALPKPILWLLQDEGSVTVLDGMPHAARKAMFLSLMTPPRLQRFDELFAEEWQRAVNAWKQKDAIVLDDAVRTVVCRTACRWAGVPLDGDAEAERRGADMMAMFDGAGAIGRRRLLAWQARRRTEAWLGGLARDVRAGDLTVDPQSAFAVVAAHRDHDGTPLSNEIVMTEMVNLIRPTVAVARYITFAALALHANPAERRLLRRATPRPSVDPAALAPETAVDDAADPVWRFVQEVRRTAPFFPLLGGRATEPLTWHGHQFRQGQRVLIDLYGTNHDPVAWPEPDRFDPDRFLGWQGDANRLIPQGAGDHASDHRCPGEWLTIATMKTAIRSLATEIDYAVASQDLELSMRRIPTRPTTGLVIRAVRDAD